MKLKAIRLLLLSTAVVLLTACGGSAEPDIEATVEARLAEEKDAEATIEAKVEERLTAVTTATAKIAKAVATPTPESTPIPISTPTPTKEPLPTPEFTAILDPMATPSLTATPTTIGSVERDPTTSEDGATVILTTSLGTADYVVTGETTKEIFDSLEESGPDTGIGEDGRFTAGLTEANRSYRYQLVDEGALCALQSASISLRQVVTLPRHVDPSALDEAQLRRWQDFAEAVAIHEQKHVDIYIEGIEAFKSQLESIEDNSGDCGLLESQIAAAWEASMASTNQDQDAFHLSEEQRSRSLREPLQLQIGRNESEVDRLRVRLDSLSLETDALKLTISEIERSVEPYKTQLDAIQLEYPDLVLPPGVFDTYQQFRSEWDTLNDERHDTVVKLNAVVQQHNETVAELNDLVEATNGLIDELAWLP